MAHDLLSRLLPEAYAGVTEGTSGLRILLARAPLEADPAKALSAALELGRRLPGTAVEWRLVRWSLRELEGHRDRVGPLFDAAGPPGVRLNRWGVNVEANVVEVGVSEPTDEVRELVEGSFGAERVRLVQEGDWIAY